MFLVQTELRNSSVHGFGVFAREFIPAGTRVWEYLDGFDRRMSPEFVASLPEVARQTVLHYCAFWKGAYGTSADNSRFLNHSFTPNLRSFEEPDCDVALRDIQIGEELTEDYREFDARFSERGISEGREGIPQASSLHDPEADDTYGDPAYWMEQASAAEAKYAVLREEVIEALESVKSWHGAAACQRGESLHAKLTATSEPKPPTNDEEFDSTLSEIISDLI